MYIVLEFQTNSGATVIVTPKTHVTLEKALQAYYTACAAAAVSSVEQHTVMLVYCNGNVIESKEFRHGEVE